MTANGLRTLLLLAHRDCRDLGEATLRHHAARAASAPPSWAAWVLQAATGNAEAVARPSGCVEILLLSYALEVDSDHIRWLREQDQGQTRSGAHPGRDAPD